MNHLFKSEIIKDEICYTKYKEYPSIYFYEALGTCHSLERTQNEKGEEITIGDPLEIEMLKFA